MTPPPHTPVSDLWIAQQKFDFSKAYAAEQWAMHDRIKARFGLLLPLCSTLATASVGGAFSKTPLSGACTWMAIGFIGTGLVCLKGMAANPWRGINLASHEVDDLLGKWPCLPTEVQALLKLSREFDTRAHANDMQLQKKRYCLKWAQVTFAVTPLGAAILALIRGGFS